MGKHDIDRDGCLNDMIRTASGYFDLANPSAGSVDVGVIAGALSKICRFGGHCPKFYSVAQHSVMASYLTVTHELEVLMHDAAEAYVGDCVKPLKNMLGGLFHEIEARIDAAIVESLGLYDDDEAHAEIRRCDLIMLRSEKAAFWPDDKEAWAGLESVPIMYSFIHAVPPQAAEDDFISRFEYLMDKRINELMSKAD